MLLTLQHRGRTTAGRLARELEVSERTILRDVEALTRITRRRFEPPQDFSLPAFWEEYSTASDRPGASAPTEL